MTQIPLNMIESLEPGHVLLHVGMYKAGTTSIQNMAASLRAELKERGIIYPGIRHNHARASHAIARRPVGWSSGPNAGKPPSMKFWHRLVAELNESPETIGLVSHEYFADYSVEICQKVAEGLGKPVTVAITVRNLITLPASTWQQYMKFGTSAALEPWLRKKLSEDFDTSTDQFHTRLLVGNVVRKWASIVGPENVVVIVLDKATPNLLTNSFEAILGLPNDFLKRHTLDPGQQNRSMTVNEVEFLRATNRAVKALPNLGWSDYLKLYRHGAIEPMLAHPEYDIEPRSLKTPKWAAEIIEPIAKAQVDAIKTSGVRILGDIDTIAMMPKSIGKNPTAKSVPIALASTFVSNIVKATAVTLDQLDEDIKVAQVDREARRLPLDVEVVLDTWSIRKVFKIGAQQFGRRLRRKAKRLFRR